MPVLRPKVLETTALGAAYLAGLTVNLWKSRDELAAHWRLDRRFEPSMDRKEAASKMARWREAVGRSRGWARPA
ncbi:Glycerol kinase [compost metagenome]